MTLDQDKKRLLQQLNALRIFERTSTVRQLRKELRQRLREIEEQISNQREKVQRRQRQIDKETSRNSKVNKLRKYHHYVRLIHSQVKDDFTYAQVRTMIKDRKAGKDVSIPDAVFDNPSP